MPENTNGKNNAATPPTNVVEKPALETALAQIEVLRGDFRNTLAGLNQLADRLKQAQRESKTSEKEIQSVRQTVSVRASAPSDWGHRCQSIGAYDIYDRESRDSEAGWSWPGANAGEAP